MQVEVAADIGKSNRIYTAAEQAPVSSLLSHATARQTQIRSIIADLEDQKRELLARLQALQDEDDVISTEIDRCRIALAPHRRLPVDVLGEIFAWCVVDEPAVDIPFWFRDEWQSSNDSYHPDTVDGSLACTSEGGSDGSSDTTDSDVVEGSCHSDWSTWSLGADDDDKPRMELPLPLILSHVCSTWRRVALSVALLWSNVSLASFTRRTKRLATKWLARAGNFPVSITIYNIAKDSAKFNLFVELKDFLLRYRIKTLELPLCSRSCPQLQFILSELPSQNILQLERLSLVDVEGNQQSPVLLKDTWYPHLQELELVGNFKVDRLTFTLPWTSLRILNMRHCHLPTLDCLDILRQCISLQACSLGVSAPSDTPSTAERSIHLHALHDLSITFNFPQAHIGTFFRHLTVPRLAALAVCSIRSLGAWADVFEWSDHDFFQMMARSQCPPLTYLTIEASQDAINVGPILAVAPGLVALALDEAKFDQDTLDGLASGQLGRDLRHLTVRALDEGRDPRKLREMIDKRKESEEGMGFVSVSVPECLPEEDYDYNQPR